MMNRTVGFFAFTIDKQGYVGYNMYQQKGVVGFVQSTYPGEYCRGCTTFFIKKEQDF